MSLIALASAKGSPGVTQAVTALASVWPREVVIADLDPIGGDSTLLQVSPEGRPLDINRGVLSLGVAVRGGDEVPLEEHLQQASSGTHVLAGVAGPSQVQGLGPIWPQISAVLASGSTDVLADLGRFAPGSAVQPVLEDAAAAVFVARADVPSLSHLRDRLHALREPLGLGHVDGTPVGFALVGDPKSTRDLSDAVRLFASSGLDVAGLGIIAHDPRTVSRWTTTSESGLRRSTYLRSIVDIRDNLLELVGSRRRAVAAVREGL